MPSYRESLFTVKYCGHYNHISWYTCVLLRLHSLIVSCVLFYSNVYIESSIVKGSKCVNELFMAGSGFIAIPYAL